VTSVKRSAQESREIGRATGILAGSTLLSRLLGLARNQILSHYFGAGIASDAFIAAFTIPNALRRLFGEGGLTPAFVSIFTRSIHGDDQDSKKSWKNFINSSFIWLSLCVGFLTLLGIWLSPYLVSLYVPEYKNIPGKYELTVHLTRVLFPFILLISWAALFMGILNSFRNFAIPAIGPAVMNLTIVILAPLGLHYYLTDNRHGIFIFAFAILTGVTIQLLIQLPALKAKDALPRLKAKLMDPQVFNLGRLLVPAVFSMGIYQLNIIVNRVFASRINTAVSHLYYADLLIELPVSLIATSMSVAAMPSFSRLFVEGDHKELGETFHFSLSMNTALAMPAMAGLLTLAAPIVSSIFQTGEFIFKDTQIVSQALFNYALGIPFYCMLRSLLPLFFAAKDTKTPAIAAFVALIVNFFGAWQFSIHLGAPGIALATSIASLVNFSILGIIALKRHPEFPWLKSLFVITKIAVATALMMLALIFLSRLIPFHIWEIEGFHIKKILSLAFLVSSGALIYALLVLILRVEPLRHLALRALSQSLRRRR